MMELHCENKLHGILIEPGVLEVKCGSRFCGAESGVVVLHQFDTTTGKLVKTLRFKEPPLGRKVHDPREHTPVRSA